MWELKLIESRHKSEGGKLSTKGNENKVFYSGIVINFIYKLKYSFRNVL